LKNPERCKTAIFDRSQSTLKINHARKPFFAANCTDFRELEKKSVPISETPHWRAAQVSVAKVFGFSVGWQFGLVTILS
jgi:hypothetical protein